MRNQTMNVNEQNALRDEASGNDEGIVPFAFFHDPVTHAVSWRRCASNAEASSYAEHNGFVLSDETLAFETIRL